MMKPQAPILKVKNPTPCPILRQSESLLATLPGNDDISKVINGITIATAIALVPVMGLVTVGTLAGATYAYSQHTGTSFWTYRSN